MAAPAAAAPVDVAAAKRALKRVTIARDLIGLRDELKAHAETTAGSMELKDAQAVHDELLESAVNDRHEEWLEAQEWPGKENGFYSRKGHPLAPDQPLRRPWPTPTSRVTHGGRHTTAEWPEDKRTADMRHEAWLDSAWPSEGWQRVNTSDHVAFTPHEFPKGRQPPPKPALWPMLPNKASDAAEAAAEAEAARRAADMTVEASEAAIRAAMHTRDLTLLREALTEHAEMAEGTATVRLALSHPLLLLISDTISRPRSLDLPAQLEAASKLVEALLEHTANMRHEARLDAQEWPSQANNFYSRKGHPLSTPFRHSSWPQTADWPPQQKDRPPTPADKDPYLGAHRRTFECVLGRNLLLAMCPTCMLINSDYR